MMHLPLCVSTKVTCSSLKQTSWWLHREAPSLLHCSLFIPLSCSLMGCSCLELAAPSQGNQQKKSSIVEMSEVAPALWFLKILECMSQHLSAFLLNHSSDEITSHLCRLNCPPLSSPSAFHLTSPALLFLPSFSFSLSKVYFLCNDLL